MLFEVNLIYFGLNDPLLAIERISDRVKKGGHSVPKEIVVRRYYRGIKNLFNYFISICDYWLVVDNSKENPEMISEGIKNVELEVFNEQIWATMKEIYYGK